jgi:uncharacterized cupredoxin-like copper-binding protein
MQMRRITAALVLGIATLLLAIPAFARATSTIDVKAKDFAFVLSAKTVHHGSIAFAIKNVGKTAHDFAIAGHTSSVIAPGTSTRLVVTLERGSYPYKCTVDAHAKLGMKGVLVVT